MHGCKIKHLNPAKTIMCVIKVETNYIVYSLPYTRLMVTEMLKKKKK